MTVATALLNRLREQGFRLTPAGDHIIVEPASRLTDELRLMIRASKPELLRVLTPLSPDLERRIHNMALRWQYRPDELAEVLNLARADPQKWLRAVALDEHKFGASGVPVKLDA